MIATPQLKPVTVRKTRFWGLAVMVMLLAASVISKTYTMVANSERAGSHLPMWEPVVGGDVEPRFFGGERRIGRERHQGRWRARS